MRMMRVRIGTGSRQSAANQGVFLGVSIQLNREPDNGFFFAFSLTNIFSLKRSELETQNAGVKLTNFLGFLGDGKSPIFSINQGNNSGASHLGKKRKLIRELPSRIMMRLRYLLALNRKKYLVNYF